MFKIKYFCMYSVCSQKKVFNKIFLFFWISVICKKIKINNKKVFIFRFARIFLNLPGYVPNLTR